MIIWDWPAVLVANAETFRIDERTSDASFTGREQVVSSGLGRWTKRMTIPETCSADDLMTVRDFIDRILRKRGGK